MNEPNAVLSRRNVETQLKGLLRVEITSRKLRKLPTGFYDTFRKTMESIDQEIEDLRERGGLQEILSLAEEKRSIESDFQAFFQRRWEKVASIAQYDIDQEDLSSLSSYEKAAILEFKAVYAKYFSQFAGGVK